MHARTLLHTRNFSPAFCKALPSSSKSTPAGLSGGSGAGLGGLVGELHRIELRGVDRRFERGPDVLQGELGVARRRR